MLRFLLGIIIIQIATVAIVLLAPSNLQGIAWLRLIIPVVMIGFFAAFWFNSIANSKGKDDLSQQQARHALEREKLQVNAERAKTRLVKKTQQQIAREAKLTHGKANFKVGATLAGAMGFGALMLLTEMITLGIMTITTAGGALSGYLYRGQKDKGKKLGLDQKQEFDKNPELEKKVIPNIMDQIPKLIKTRK